MSSLLKCQKQHFNPDTIATVSCEKEKEKKRLKSGVKLKSFNNMRVIEEGSFHANVDFKCSTVFENQLVRSKSATDLINRKRKSKLLLFPLC